MSALINWRSREGGRFGLVVAGQANYGWAEEGGAGHLVFDVVHGRYSPSGNTAIKIKNTHTSAVNATFSFNTANGGGDEGIDLGCPSLGPVTVSFSHMSTEGAANPSDTWLLCSGRDTPSFNTDNRINIGIGGADTGSLLAEGWTHIVLDIGQRTAVGDTGDDVDDGIYTAEMSYTPNGAQAPNGLVLNKVRYFRAVVPAQSTIAIDGLVYNRRIRPAIAFCFDDVGDNRYFGPASGGNETWQSLLDARNLVGNFFPNIATIDTSAHTTADLQAAAALGHMIGNHSISSDEFDALTDSTRDSYLRQAITWHKARGFDGDKYLAYPGGKVNARIIADMKRLGFRMGRAIVGESHSSTFLNQIIDGIDNRYRVNAVQMADGGNITSLAHMQTMTKALCRRGGLLVTYSHQLQTAGGTSPLAQAAAIQIFDHVAELRDRGLVDVVTLKQYDEGFTTSDPVPIVNLTADLTT